MNRGEPLRVPDYLGHIAQAVANIAEYTSGMDHATYRADRKTQDAVIRNFEVIGEACNNIVKQDADYAKAHPEIPWGVAYGMRNALSHGYFKVDHDVVWRAIQVNLPEFGLAVRAALKSLPAD